MEPFEFSVVPKRIDSIHQPNRSMSYDSYLGEKKRERIILDWLEACVISLSTYILILILPTYRPILLVGTLYFL